MTICILVNWKSLGHLRLEASSPHSERATLPLEWKHRKASPLAARPPQRIHGRGQTITAQWLVCVTNSKGIRKGFPQSECGDKKLEGRQREKK